MPFVQQRNDKFFMKQFSHLIATKDLSMSFDEPRFYSTIIRGNVFTTSYLSQLGANHLGKVIHKSTVLRLIYGEKKNGKWLIGNYNCMRYDDYDSSANH